MVMHFGMFYWHLLCACMVAVFDSFAKVITFYQPGTRLAGPKIVFMFSVSVCVCVCVRPQISRALNYSIIFVTMPL